MELENTWSDSHRKPTVCIRCRICMMAEDDPLSIFSGSLNPPKTLGLLAPSPCPDVLPLIPPRGPTIVGSLTACPPLPLLGDSSAREATLPDMLGPCDLQTSQRKYL